ncbi:MAG: signal peptidase I [bacterium]
MLKEQIKALFGQVFELIKIVVISLAIIIPIRYYLIQPFYVKGASMEPTFYDQEYLIVNEIGYRINPPQRGDVIVFRYPRDPQEYFIKRIIGLPGEKVQVKDGKVIIFNQANNWQGATVIEDYLPKNLKTYGMNDDIVTLSSEEYYVLGDNRNASKDSRVFGPVNKSFLIGRVWLRGFPFSRAQYFPEKLTPLNIN